MRITFLNSLYPPHGASGAENTLRILAAGLAAHGHACSVLTLSPESVESDGTVDGIPVKYVPLANVFWPHGGERPRHLRPVFQMLDAYNPAMEPRVRRALATLKPDVLHCHNLQGFSVSAWRAAERLHIPVVQTVHDYYLACPRSAMWRPSVGNCERLCTECSVFATPRRALSGIPSAVTCVSNRVAERIVRAGVFREQQEHGRIHIIRGCNSSVPAGGAEPHVKSGVTFGFIGRLDPSKGLEHLISALGRLPQSGVALLIAGNGPDAYVAHLRNLAMGQKNIAFLGHVAADKFYRQIDILVIPSVWEDPFPRVFHEALAYGIPSVVTPLGGLAEVIEPGRTGFVTKGHDAAALYETLEPLVTTGWDRSELSANCLAASENYTAERIVSEYESVLANAASEKHEASGAKRGGRLRFSEVAQNGG